MAKSSLIPAPGTYEDWRYNVGAEKGFFEWDWVNAGSPNTPKLEREFSGKIQWALGGWTNEKWNLVPVEGFYRMSGNSKHWLLNGKALRNLCDYVPTKRDFSTHMWENLAHYTAKDNLSGYWFAWGRGVTEFETGNVSTFWVIWTHGYEIATLRQGMVDSQEILYTPASPKMLATEYHTVLRI
jgi:hypothetical protein